MKEKKIKTIVTLRGNALELVLSEQRKYHEEDTIRGKSKIVNQLLVELQQLRGAKSVK